MAMYLKIVFLLRLKNDMRFLRFLQIVHGAKFLLVFTRENAMIDVDFNDHQFS